MLLPSGVTEQINLADEFLRYYRAFAEILTQILTVLFIFRTFNNGGVLQQGIISDNKTKNYNI